MLMGLEIMIIVFFNNFFNNYNLRFLVRIRQDALINNEFQDFDD